MILVVTWFKPTVAVAKDAGRLTPKPNGLVPDTPSKLSYPRSEIAKITTLLGALVFWHLFVYGSTYWGLYIYFRFFKRK